MRSLWKDVVYGWRMVLRAPVVAIVAALSLAVGIAANAVIFSWMQAFLFESFPFHDPDRVVFLFEQNQHDGNDQGVAPGNFIDWRERCRSFESMAAYNVVPMNLFIEGAPQSLRVATTTPELFDVVGRSPALGRPLRPEEASSGEGGSPVLASYSFFQRQFGGREEALGSAVRLNGQPFTVVGVMPEDFALLPANVDLYSFVDIDKLRHVRDQREWLVLARLSGKTTPARAQDELSTVAQALEEEFPETNRGFGIHVQELSDVFPGEVDSRLVKLMMVVGSFVLLIACANVANLLLSQAEGRQKEIAVRRALGAGRGRILRQLLFESVLLSLFAAALGWGLAVFGIRSAAAAMPAELPPSFVPEVNTSVLLYTLLLAVIAGLAFGSAPALHTLQGDLRGALNEGTRGGTLGRSRKRLRSTLVVAQIAIALTLLVGARTLQSAFTDMVERNPGFDVNSLVTFTLNAGEDRYPEDADVARFYDQLAQRLADLPAVEGVATMRRLPRSREMPTETFTIDGRPLPEASEAPRASWQPINVDYFTTLGIAIEEGRAFEVTDRADSQPVVVINLALAQKHFKSESPLGKHLTAFGTSREIVGVSSNVLQARIVDDEGITPALFVPLLQVPRRDMSFALRTPASPEALAPDLRAAIWSLDPEQPVSLPVTLRKHIQTELAGPQVLSVVLIIFGVTALLLSAIGLYGVVAHNVAQSRREISIRMALGADRSRVVQTVTRSGLLLLAIGLGIGAPMTVLMMLAIRKALFGIAIIQTTAFIVIPLVLSASALLACLIPAMRASKTAPATVLTGEL